MFVCVQVCESEGAGVFHLSALSSVRLSVVSSSVSGFSRSLSAGVSGAPACVQRSDAARVFLHALGTQAHGGDHAHTHTHTHSNTRMFVFVKSGDIP